MIPNSIQKIALSSKMFQYFLQQSADIQMEIKKCLGRLENFICSFDVVHYWIPCGVTVSLNELLDDPKRYSCVKCTKRGFSKYEIFLY